MTSGESPPSSEKWLEWLFVLQVSGSYLVIKIDRIQVIGQPHHQRHPDQRCIVLGVPHPFFQRLAPYPIQIGESPSQSPSRLPILESHQHILYPLVAVLERSRVVPAVIELASGGPLRIADDKIDPVGFREAKTRLREYQRKPGDVEERPHGGCGWLRRDFFKSSTSGTQTTFRTILYEVKYRTSVLSSKMKCTGQISSNSPLI